MSAAPGRPKQARTAARMGEGTLMNTAPNPPASTSVARLVDRSARMLEVADVSFGHGTENAWDEAAWLVLWQLGLPLATELDDPTLARPTPDQLVAVERLITRRITSRQPAAYLTGEAWLQGVPFFADQRCIVPRSLIAEPLVSGGLDSWLVDDSTAVLDMCTGGASLAILAAMAWPIVLVDACDVSASALEVAASNVARHGLQSRVRLLQGDGMCAAAGCYDLVLCNPPYVNNHSMAGLPAEYRAEPALALAGGSDGMDFIRTLLRDAPARMQPQAALVLEIGNERSHFAAAFPGLDAVWLDTSAGCDQVCVLTRDALVAAAGGQRD